MVHFSVVVFLDACTTSIGRYQTSSSAPNATAAGSEPPTCLPPRPAFSALNTAAVPLLRPQRGPPWQRRRRGRLVRRPAGVPGPDPTDPEHRRLAPHGDAGRQWPGLGRPTSTYQCPLYVG